MKLYVLRLVMVVSIVLSCVLKDKDVVYAQQVTEVTAATSGSEIAVITAEPELAETTSERTSEQTAEETSGETTGIPKLLTPDVYWSEVHPGKIIWEDDGQKNIYKYEICLYKVTKNGVKRCLKTQTTNQQYDLCDTIKEKDLVGEAIYVTVQALAVKAWNYADSDIGTSVLFHDATIEWRPRHWYYDNDNWNLFNFFYNEFHAPHQNPSPSVSNKTPRNGWELFNGSWYFYENGQKKKGWIDNGHYYCDPATGKMVIGWIVIDNNWYYFDGTGLKVENQWVYYNGEWYYLQYGGIMLANAWIYHNKNWYWLTGSGAILKNSWLEYNRNWYYLGAEGEMYEDEWVMYKNAHYYLQADGIMATGPKYINGKHYYFLSSGELLR